MNNLQSQPGQSSGGMRSEPAVDELLGLFERVAVPIYRYHLLRSGDPAAAESRTAQTFLTARQRSTEYRKPGTTAEAWLWRIALAVRPGQVTDQAQEFSLAQPTLGPDADFSDSEPESLRMQRALIPPITQALDRLPPRQAQLLGLLLFGDRTPGQAAEIMGASPDSLENSLNKALLRLAELLSSDPETASAVADILSLQDALHDLASRAFPDPRFLQAVKIELARTDLPHRAAAGPSSGPPFFTQKALRQFAWVPMVAVGVFIFAASIWSLPARLAPIPTPQPTQAFKPAPTSVPMPVTSGILAPASTATCVQVKTAVEEALNIRADLTPDAPFLDPLFDSQDHNGSGCEIYGSARGDILRDTDHIINSLTSVLARMGYQIDGQFESNTSCPACFQFPMDWFGKGLVFAKSDGRALLAVGWRPVSATLCAAGSTPSTCPLPPNDEAFSVRLDLADDPARKTLAEFFFRWQNGDRTALDLVSSDLQKRLTSLADLDSLAGVEQNQVAHAQVSWRVWPPGLGTIQMLVNLSPSDPYQAQVQNQRPFTRLHVVLKQDQGSWRIQNIWQVGFERAGDTAFMADPQGRILEIPSAGGSPVALTDAGFFRPPREPGATPPDTRYRLSPDGQWLALSLPTFNVGNPDRARSASGTWLVSTGGSGAHQIDTHPLRLAWAPNSRRFAYISPTDPQAIFAYDLDTGGSYVITRLSGPVRGMAWSPDSQHMAVSYTVAWQGAGEGPNQIELAYVTTSNNRALPMVDLPTNLPGLPDPDLELHWVKSGSELWLWYIPAMIAVDANTGDVRSLMPLSRASVEFLRQPGRGSPNQIISQISPDGWFMANSFNEGFQGSADWVAVHFILPGADTPSIGSAVQRIGAVSALAWTGDSQSLIVAGGVDSPQPLWRMDVVTGEKSELAQSVAFLGLRSSLLRESQHALPEVTLSRQPQPQSQTIWVQKDLPEYHLRFDMPLFWQYYGPGQNLGWALITSGSFSNLFGVASIPPDQQVIQISVQPGDLTQSGPVLAGPTTIEKVGGKTAYRLAAPAYAGGPLVIQIPVTDQVVTISVYPFPAAGDATLQHILDSITFE